MHGRQRQVVVGGVSREEDGGGVARSQESGEQNERRNELAAAREAEATSDRRGRNKGGVVTRRARPTSGQNAGGAQQRVVTHARQQAYARKPNERCHKDEASLYEGRRFQRGKDDTRSYNRKREACVDMRVGA